MVLEPGSERCASEDAEPRRGWTLGGVPATTLDPESGGCL